MQLYGRPAGRDQGHDPVGSFYGVAKIKILTTPKILFDDGVQDARPLIRDEGDDIPAHIHLILLL